MRKKNKGLVLNPTRCNKVKGKGGRQNETSPTQSTGKTQSLQRSPLLLYKRGQDHIKECIHASIRSVLEDSVSMEQPVIQLGSIPIDEVYEGVHGGPILGVGVSGEVRLIRKKKTGELFALKRLDMSILGNGVTLKQLDITKVKKERYAFQLLEEVQSMCMVDHPNIVRLEEIYESDKYIYLVEELLPGGELFDRLDEQTHQCFTEEQCRHIVWQMVSAVRYIHSLGIIHRDLKLENFLLKKQDSLSELKLIDFGLAKHLKSGEKVREKVGTPYTVAPEILLGTYDERCDVWAIGVLTYLLLCGETPFGGNCGEPLTEVRDNILSGDLEFYPKEIWDNISDEAKDFILTSLQVDPKQRPTSTDLMKMPWLQRKSGNCWLNCNHILQKLFLESQ